MWCKCCWKVGVAGGFWRRIRCVLRRLWGREDLQELGKLWRSWSGLLNCGREVLCVMGVLWCFLGSLCNGRAVCACESSRVRR